MKPKGEITYIPNTTIKEILIAILIILNLIMCFKGLKLDTENRELKEKIENLEGNK